MQIIRDTFTDKKYGLMMIDPIVERVNDKDLLITLNFTASNRTKLKVILKDNKNRKVEISLSFPENGRMETSTESNIPEVKKGDIIITEAAPSYYVPPHWNAVLIRINNLASVIYPIIWQEPKYQ